MKKTEKRILAVLMVFVLMFLVTACGGSPSGSKPSDPKQILLVRRPLRQVYCICQRQHVGCNAC